MSTLMEYLRDSDIQQLGAEAAQRARLAKPTLLEQIRHVIEHEADVGSEAGTEVSSVTMRCTPSSSSSGSR